MARSPSWRSQCAPTACRRDFKSHVIGLEVGCAPVESDHLPAATLGWDETRAEGGEEERNSAGLQEFGHKIKPKKT